MEQRIFKKIKEFANIKRNARTQIHLAVLLFGFSSIFPKLISLSSTGIVLGRVFFASVSLFIYLLFKKMNLRLKKKDLIIIFITGGILSLHWVSFFQSIRESSISIGVLSFSTFPLLLSFLEPIIFKEKFYKRNLIFSIISLMGIILIIPKFDVENLVFIGVSWGLLSALTYAILMIINRYLMKRVALLKLVFFQNFFAFIILFFYGFAEIKQATSSDFIYLLILGIFGTALAHALFINSLKKIKVYNAGIINCLEIFYAVLFSIIIFREIPELRVFFGGILLVSVNYFVGKEKRTHKKL